MEDRVPMWYLAGPYRERDVWVRLLISLLILGAIVKKNVEAQRRG